MIFFLAAVGLVAASCGTKQPAKLAGINYDYMDTSARPGDDFAQYATGHWSDFNPQPPEYPSWGAFAKLGEENIKTLKELRDSDQTGDGIKIQVIQTLQKIMKLVEGEPQDDTTPTEESIMAKIRGGKK